MKINSEILRLILVLKQDSDRRIWRKNEKSTCTNLIKIYFVNVRPNIFFELFLTLFDHHEDVSKQKCDSRGLKLDFCFFLQIAPSAKKLWGVEESKEEGPKGILNMNGGDIQCGSVWRDSTWSTSGN